jgi:hypothetical protein
MTSLASIKNETQLSVATTVSASETGRKTRGGARGRTWTDGEIFALLDSLGIGAICDMITSGLSMRTVAEHAGVSPNALWRWLAADLDRSARARAARALTAWHWDELAEKVINSATDVLELGKARELAHHYRWRASKIAPKEYGDRIEHSGSIDMNVGLAERIECARQRVIECVGEVVVMPPGTLPGAATDGPEQALRSSRGVEGRYNAA